MSGDNKLLQDIDGFMEEYFHASIIGSEESNVLQWMAVGILCLVLVTLLLSFIVLIHKFSNVT